MLEKVKQYGLEKFAGDADLADEFVKGFVKKAFDLGEFNKGVGSAVGKGIGGTVIGLALSGVGKAMSNVQTGALHSEFMQALERAVASNPILKQADREKVINYADTVFKFAPHVATDSNLLSSILANAIHGDGIDPMTIRTLTDLESRYVENKTGSAFSPKTYV